MFGGKREKGVKKVSGLFSWTLANAAQTSRLNYASMFCGSGNRKQLNLTPFPDTFSAATLFGVADITFENARDSFVLAPR
jgi:hypothetical protein